MVAATKKQRVERTPIHAQTVLLHAEREGFKQRWVSDYPGRIEKFLLAGYAFVRKEGAKLSTEQIQDPSMMDDSCIRRVVNKSLAEGSGRHGYLMEIPLEWWNDDQDAKMKKLDKSEEDIDPYKLVKGNLYGDGLKM